MSRFLAPHLAAAALGFSLGPVNAQLSAPVTIPSAPSVILAQYSSTAKGAQMARPKGDTPAEISNSVPTPRTGGKGNAYAVALDNMSRGLADAIDEITRPVVLQLRHAHQNGPYLVTGTLPDGKVDSKSFPRDFMQFYHDLNGEQTGRTINVQRVAVSSEEDFKMLQDKDFIGKKAEWHGAGRYMVTAGAFAADRNGANVAVTPVDPYGYLEYAKFKVDANGQRVKDPKTHDVIIENMNDPQLQNALIRCDPHYFGLPRDPAAQPTAPLGRPNASFTLQSGAPAAQSGRPQPNRPQPGTNVTF